MTGQVEKNEVIIITDDGDEFKVVNPATYSSNGVVNTMFGPLPEMKGKTVAITASYGRHKDKIYIKLR